MGSGGEKIQFVPLCLCFYGGESVSLLAVDPGLNAGLGDFYRKRNRAPGLWRWRGEFIWSLGFELNWFQSLSMKRFTSIYSVGVSDMSCCSQHPTCLASKSVPQGELSERKQHRSSAGWDAALRGLPGLCDDHRYLHGRSVFTWSSACKDKSWAILLTVWKHFVPDCCS